MGLITVHVKYCLLITFHRKYIMMITFLEVYETQRKLLKVRFYPCYFPNMDQAQPTGEHRIYAQTCTCTNSSFGFFSSLFLISFFCSPFRLTQLIPLQRRFLGPRYIGDDFFFRAEIYRGRLFLGAKQEGLTIVHCLNKLIVSCKETVRVPF